MISASLPPIPGKTLFIFTEPDDALFYFFPSILQSEFPILLCISTVYIDELAQSTKFFNTFQQFGNVTCIFDTNFTSKGLNWQKNDIIDIIVKYIEQYNPQRIFTFGLNGEINNKLHDIQISQSLSYIPKRVGEVSIQKLADLSLSYQNSTHQDINSYYSDHDNKLSIPIYFLKSEPLFLRYSGYAGPLLYAITNSVNKGIFVITPPNELISMSVRCSLFNNHNFDSWKLIFEMMFSRYFYFNHFLQQQLTSIQT